MSLNYSSDQINELIRQNEKVKKYFYKEISPRFSDCIYNGKIHLSKYFEFFEMARFDIMHGFYDYYKNKKELNGDISLGSFVVVRIQCENYSGLNVSFCKDVQVKTALIIHQKPLLEFEQTAFTDNGDLPSVKANIKIAIVDSSFQKVDNWDKDVLLAMLEFINAYGKEELL